METKGPIEDREWPEQLTARVIDPSAPARLHGYDVENDLARHYSFGELVLTALSGTVPDDDAGRAFEIALAFSAIMSVGEGPTHAAVLARLCGARNASVTAVAMIAIAEHARATSEEHEALMPRLVTGALNGLAIKFKSRTDEERESVGRLRTALGAFCRRVPSLGYDLRLETATIAVFMACGLRTRESIETAFCVARLAPTCAEAHAVSPGDFRAYPMNLPNFEYEVRA